MEGIQVSTEPAGSGSQLSVIKVGGYIDTTTSSEVERSLNGLLKQGRYQIIIDLGNVDYISSAGWGIFISEIKAIRENNGDLKLVRMIPDVYEIFELLEFHHILDVYDSLDEAIGKFEESQFVEVVTGQPAAEPKAPTPPPAPKPQTPFGGEMTPGQPMEPIAGEPVASSQPVEPVAEDVFEDRSEESIPQVRRNLGPRDLVNMSTEDKIRHIVARNPDIGAFKINKRLNSADFGFTKVGWFGVRSQLNKLGLNSRKARNQFAKRQNR
ncbi:MAG: STAS domain-containing protein [Calditrichia bacterium]